MASCGPQEILANYRGKVRNQKPRKSPECEGLNITFACGTFAEFGANPTHYHAPGEKHSRGEVVEGSVQEERAE